MPAAPRPSAEATRPQDSAVKSADRVLDILELLARARPLVSWLADTTDEAASFSLFRDDEVERVCVAKSRSPLYSTSAGNAILAGLSTTDLAAYLKRVPPRLHTSATVRTGRRVGASR